MQILGIGDEVRLPDGRVGQVSTLLPVRNKIGDLITPLVRIHIGEGSSVVVDGKAFESLQDTDVEQLT